MRPYKEILLMDRRNELPVNQLDLVYNARQCQRQVRWSILPGGLSLPFLVAGNVMDILGTSPFLTAVALTIGVCLLLGAAFMFFPAKEFHLRTWLNNRSRMGKASQA
jgi:hypothetical protein